MKKKLGVSGVIYYVVLSIMALVIIFPFVWLVSTSFDYFKSYTLPYPPRMFPKEFSTFNYKMALTNVPIVRYLTNTVIIAAVDVILNVFIATLVAVLQATTIAFIFFSYRISATSKLKSIIS